MRKNQESSNLIYPAYKNKPIWTIKDLTKLLGVDKNLLIDKAEQATYIFLKSQN
jgi:hypothetical protein